VLGQVAGDCKSQWFIRLAHWISISGFLWTGEIMSDGTSVPGAHDGMARRWRNTTILVRNHELSPDSSSKVEAPESQQYDPSVEAVQLR